MGLVAFLISGYDREVSFGPATVEKLARLGVTNASVLRDADTVCLVLEGWAFEGAGAATHAASALGEGLSIRTLHPVMQTALGVVPSESKRRTNR